MCPSPGIHMCPHTDVHGHACTPRASTDVWSLLGAPLPSPRVPGDLCLASDSPMPLAAGHKDPSRAQPRMPQPQGSRGGLLGVQPPVNQECKSGHAGNTCEWPGRGQGVPGTGGQSRSPPGCQVQQGGPTSPPSIGETWLFWCCPPELHCATGQGSPWVEAGSGPGRGAPSSCPGEAEGGQWKVLAHPKLRGVWG